MPTTIIWTAVPAGLGPNNRMKVSVYLSPRLTGAAKETTLAEFPMFQDWPAQIAKIQQQIQVRYGATVIKPAAYGPLPNSEYWRNLFKPATLVKSYGWQERSTRIKNRWRGVRSYPADDVHGIVREKYTKLAKDNPTNPPVAATIIREENLGLIGFHGGAGTPAAVSPEAIVTQRLEQKFMANKFVPRSTVRAAGGQLNPDATKEAMLQVRHFFVRPSQLAVRAAMERAVKLKQAPPPPPPVPPPPPLDFHEQLGALGSFPFMMRQTGIVIDMELQIPPGTPAASELQIVVPAIAGVTNVTPKTKILANFFPMPNPKPDPADPSVASDVANGMLRLGPPVKATDPKYQVVMLDLDGAALNLMKFATDMQRAEELRLQKLEKASINESQANPSYADFCSQKGRNLQGNMVIAAQAPVAQKLAISKFIVDQAGAAKEEPLPALRSAGITVIRSERNKKTVSMLKRQATLHDKVAAPPGTVRAGEEEFLYADDLVRGYAVDIFSNATGKWHSVCSRIGTYEFMDAPATKLANIVDEAAVEAAGVEDKATTDLYHHEAIFRWTGWSLAVPRPGKSLDDKSNLAPRDGRQEFQKGLRLTTDFKVPPGSLPKLRYGTKYKVRARVVDLAGNVLAPTSPLANIPEVMTKEFTYTRFAPVAAPQISLCADPKPAESTMHLVIRSNYNTPLYEPDTQRYITPPPGSEGMAEEHGRLDGAQNMLADKGGLKTYDVVRNNDRTLRDVKRAQNAAITEEPMQNEPALVFPPGSLTEVPYLPDPLANGALIRNVPAAGPRRSLAVPFSAAPSWFDHKPFRIRVVEGNQNPEYDAAQRILTIFLPKGERYNDLLLSTVPEGTAVDYLGVNQWLVEMNVPVAQRAEVVKHMRDGVHWMTSPHYSISIVHALQQPLTAPKFGSLRSNRDIGDTYTVLSDTNLAVHGKSTLKLDIVGAWKEWIDRPRGPKPAERDRKAIAFDLNVLSHQTSLILPPDPPAGTRQLQFQAVAVQAMPIKAISQLMLKPGYRHEFNDTKHRMISYKAVGMTRFKEYFADKVGLKDPDFQRESTPVTVNVLNSARPDAPKVAYIIPSFGWSKVKSTPADQDPKKVAITSKRSGGGLRIYLERPWYSSGNGEKLAVILSREAKPSTKMETLVSRWGKDPIWRTQTNRLTELVPSDFPLVSKSRDLQGFNLSSVATAANPSISSAAKAQLSPTIKAQPGLQVQPADTKVNPGIAALIQTQLLTLAELNDDTAQSVLVAAHDVFYDENRDLWYCDIEIDMPKEYFPFVQLSLARFQPNSLMHCHLSRLVRAEFIQLSPERTVSIVPAAAPGQPITGQQFTVTHTGATYDAPGRPGIGPMRVPPAGPNLIRVTVEQKRPDGGGNMGWVPIAGEPYELKFRSMSGSTAVHSEVVSLPGVRSEFRLIVQEFEMHYAGEMNKPETQGRLIFADAVEL